jgi:hypothetical protein
MRPATPAVLILSAFALAPAASAQLVIPGGSAPSPASSPAPSSAPSASPNGVISQFDADTFAQLFTSAGFASKSAIMSDNKTHFVSTQFWPNTSSGVLPIACDNNGANCISYEIVTVLNNETAIGDPWTDAWNNNFWFVKAVKNGTDLIFEMDVMLSPGVTPAYIEQTAQVFKGIVDQAATFNPNGNSNNKQ